MRRMAVGGVVAAVGVTRTVQTRLAAYGALAVTFQAIEPLFSIARADARRRRRRARAARADILPFVIRIEGICVVTYHSSRLSAARTPRGAARNIGLIRMTACTESARLHADVEDDHHEAETHQHICTLGKCTFCARVGVGVMEDFTREKKKVRMKQHDTMLPKYSRFQASVTLSDPREGEGVTDPRVERVIAYFMYLAT